VSTLDSATRLAVAARKLKPYGAHAAVVQAFGTPSTRDQGGT
jgi:hypothetical protein